MFIIALSHSLVTYFNTFKIFELQMLIFLYENGIKYDFSDKLMSAIYLKVLKVLERVKRREKK